MSVQYYMELVDKLIEDDFEVIFNTDSGHAYLHDILSYVYNNLSLNELKDECIERGLDLEYEEEL